MVNQLRTHLFDTSSPNPASKRCCTRFPAAQVCRSQSRGCNPAITNRPDGEALVKEIFGDRVGIVVRDARL